MSRKVYTDNVNEILGKSLDVSQSLMDKIKELEQEIIEVYMFCDSDEAVSKDVYGMDYEEYAEIERKL